MPPYEHARSAFDTRIRRGSETSFASSVRCVNGARSAGRSAKRLAHKSAGEFRSRPQMVSSSYWKASECELFRACPTILIGSRRHAGKKWSVCRTLRRLPILTSDRKWKLRRHRILRIDGNRFGRPKKLEA